MQENARQGFWNGSKAPYGYAVVAAEQRGAKTKKRLAIDPVEAEVVRLMFRLFREGDEHGRVTRADDDRRQSDRIHQLGKGRRKLATGSLAALAGKPYTWTAKSAGPGQFTIEVKQ
jgi:DNA invertase Pin-like site-specific DNA recombinase